MHIRNYWRAGVALTFGGIAINAYAAGPATQPITAADVASTAPANPANTAAAARIVHPSTQPDQTMAETASQLGNVTVTSDLDEVRDQIAPSLGAQTYSIGQSQIAATPQGENASFQQVLLRAPGVVLDSFGQEHVRGEHGNLTYRLNGVILPEGLNGFGQEIDTRLIDTVTLIDGTLPAQFGFRTAGIVDVTTKSGQSLNGGEVSIYGGSNDTFQPSFQFGGASGKLDFYVSGSYLQNDLGIENTTGSLHALHDDTEQQRLFAYANYRLDDTSRLSLIVNASNADFQIPDVKGAPPAFTLANSTGADSARIDENQNEQQYYSVLSYQTSINEASLQASIFSQYGQIHFTPDHDADLIFQGVSGNVFNNFWTNGAQLDSSYILNDRHTLRAGFIGDYTTERLNTDTSVFPVDPGGAQTSTVPENISDSSGNQALSAGIYVQDEWRITKSLTLNYGLRFDWFDSNFDSENQLSPRANLVWKIDEQTTAHVGYSRYFVPPPLQNVNGGTLDKFAGTTNAPGNFGDDPPRVERSDYYDIGIGRQITEPWFVGFDGFYKYAHQLVDLGQFGDAVILAPYNYSLGRVYGAEFSTTYKQGGLSLFGNFAWVKTAAHDIDSQQFEFDPDELAYIDDHNIKLDHESEFTSSAGASYSWKHNLVYVDALYGSGLRSGFANTGQEPSYHPVNVGYEHDIPVGDDGKNMVKLRFDVVNVFDEAYQIRDGSGLGVAAPQYGERRAFLVGLTYAF